jgi:hypothetical protein
MRNETIERPSAEASPPLPARGLEISGSDCSGTQKKQKKKKINKVPTQSFMAVQRRRQHSPSPDSSRLCANLGKTKPTCSIEYWFKHQQGHVHMSTNYWFQAWEGNSMCQSSIGLNLGTAKSSHIGLNLAHLSTNSQPFLGYCRAGQQQKTMPWKRGVHVPFF